MEVTTAEVKPSTDSASETTGPKFDEMSEAMVSTASEYFLGRLCLDDESEEEFRERTHRFFETFRPGEPLAGRMVFAAGLLATGFDYETEPVKVSPPEAEPESVLSPGLLINNHRSVAGALIDMGIATIIHRTSSTYNEDILQRLAIDFAPTVDNDL